MRTIQHFVDGTDYPGTSGNTQPVLNPSLGTPQAEVALANKVDVDHAIANAAKAQKKWAQQNPQKRIRVLMAWIQLIHQHMDELARTLSLEHGKIFEDAKGDIQRGVDVLEFALGAPHQLKGEYSSGVGPGIDTYSLRQPLGVVAGITPFNFPAMIPLWKAGPAIAAGNAFILKPSERDPSVPVRLAELFIEAGGPEGILNVVHGDKEAVDALLDSETIQAIGFVGSTPIAQYIYERCAASGKRSQCFGGAKNHAIVLPDADLEATADTLVGAAFGSAGERCMALSVVVPVGKETAEKLREALIRKIPQLHVGHCLDPRSDYGALVTADAKERVERLITEGVNDGADLVIDGRTLDMSDATFEGESLSQGFYTGPSFFDHVTTDMSIYTEEIFGPVLSMVRAETLEEAIKLPSEHRYGNGVAIFTRDGGAARDFITNVDVGMVGINVPIPVPIAYYTFGGWKASGFGDLNQHGPDSFRFYTKTKTVTARWPENESAGPQFTMPVMD
ncbi:CoA-acylating methylmalonate-semialdehyde dehydrogenase [Corynebacterium poyangense]|uniref:methylmalonate-semialdehyde dehydrogenase (CoA acylating) n=1 Tax=Corynebacterium poyangense TaxID=2684405 RepID=A0A7H0SS16_9CORY|nr:CoA-acylating methylmalonate-semialdehyde dehydrogenase [Corynebacterium poyangense]MBZ8177377.1 CoA-acylating methylmalonate-semialdehyde dehydrogenase [Corynebacterium poyangense]QNQ91341.1 CoA-acylating methylmalonate-semialdehyde dehydrogenase [Corynebacterium poyangense]